jgi:hypothetical protein
MNLFNVEGLVIVITGGGTGEWIPSFCRAVLGGHVLPALKSHTHDRNWAHDGHRSGE